MNSVLLSIIGSSAFLKDAIKVEDVKFNEVVGQGGFGVVHHGYWKGREVALKRIKVPAGAITSSLPTPMEVSVLK